MKKRLVSMFLILAMCMGLAVPAYAAEEYDIKTFATEEDLTDYNQITVFSRENQNNLDENSSYLSRIKAQDNFDQARDAVLALNLTDQGYSYIEKACLSELDALKNTPNCILNEYTVLIPKSRATAPSLYATYKGIDFYTSVTSKSNITIEKLKYGKYEQLAQWAANGINLALVFADVGYVTSFGWALISSNLPTNYAVHQDDWTDCFANINPINRAIYVKDGSNYKNVVNREYGFVRPYTVYHYNNANSSTGAAVTNFPQELYPDATGSMKDALLYNAYKVYTSGASAVNFLLKNRVSFEWKSNS